ncbi:DUF3883 domain-containing protein [Microcoleus sp. EPA2]|uniref:DUF3883 domain-containing protein n=1 Tax=unclassified Microcoleus TaxID=2642155 RepID=UPI00312B310D
MSKELRYLLHGNKEKYDDVQTPLYIIPQESTLWQKIGLQVLTSRKEDWRLINSVFIDSLPTPTANLKRLGIEKLLAEQVVDLIRQNPESVDGSLLNKSERYELLAYISQKPSNQDLWKSLRLHENANNPNRLESIEVDRVYLENSDFSLDERLKNYIVLIRQNTEIQQHWIPSWTPDAAIAKVLSLPNPHQYYGIILDALQRMTDETKESHKESLKSSGWLPPNGYCPQDILKLPKNLEQYAKEIASLDKSKHPQQVLHESVRKSKVEHWIKSLFTVWNAEIVIKKILTHNQKNIEHWQSFCPVILDALSTNISDELKTILTREIWLFLGGRTVCLSQIIETPRNKLQKHLSTLVRLSAGEYAEMSQLPKEITNHKNFPILNKFFSQWKENDVLEFILAQNEPHKYFEIILDALSSLLPQSTPNNVNTQKLSTLAWLVDKQGNAIDPKSMILHYPSLNEQIEDLLSLVPDCYISSSQLAKEFRDHNDCSQWLTKKLFITEDEALIKIGKLLKQAPKYQIGEFSVEEFPLDKCLEAFKQFDVSFLPAWNFANNLSKEKFKTYLLPNLLDKMDVAKLRELLISLSSPASQVDAANVEIFNTYLGLAINYETFSTDILPHIHLLNRKGQWKSPKKLTKEGNNIDDNYVLDEEQLNIIHSFLKSETQGNHDLPESDEASEDENSILINYFKKWEDHCQLEPIGAFLSLFKSSDNKIKEQAKYYLGRRNIEHLQARLLKNTEKPIRVFQVHIGQAEKRTCKVTSILGCTFEAELANLPNPPHFFVNEGELASNPRRLELLDIQPKKIARPELVRILKDSTRVLLKKVYGVEPNIEAIWEDLLNSDQLDIRVAENYLIDSAENILRTLGIKDDRSIPTRLILAQLKDLDDLRHQKAQYKEQGLEREQQDTEKAFQEKLSKLWNLLKENEDVKNILLNFVRTKIVQLGYRLQSIPFELFQNADDAVVEWQEMSLPKEVENERKEFVVVMSDRQLLFIHTGRPIGCFQHPDHPQDRNKYRNKGYDRDLEKMLIFNNSDKGADVTGTFGLGFKSVYLSCKQPRILSNRLCFAVEGGLIPSRLSPEETKGLQEKLDLYKMPSNATIVELELDEDIQPQDIIREFQERAGILTVFSRAITKYRFINDTQDNDSKSFTWERQNFLGIQGVEINRITINGEYSLRLCLRTESGSALLLDMTERDGRLSCTTPDAPTFWVTAPTQEKLSVGFILNAAFKVTTGRTKLDSTEQNKELANNIGIALGQLLKKLCEANWEDVKVALGFSSVDSYSFWEFLWKELAVNWQKLGTNEQRDLISGILGGDRGMGYLITHSEALPNGLYGQYRKLIRINSNTKYFKVTGKLAESSCFCEVASWSSFYKSSDPRSLIVDTQWEEATKLLDKSLFDKLTINIDDIQLLKALKTEVGVIEAKVTPEKARQVGKLISKSFLNSFNNSSECDSLKNFLPQIKFQSKAGNYLPSEQLLSATSDQAEEKLLVGFAPDDRLLHVDYTDTAIDFFYACRLQRKSISVEDLQEWVLRAETTEKRQAIHGYLSKGEHREQLAKLLHENPQDSWIKKDQSINGLIDRMMAVITEREKKYQREPTDSIVQNNQQGLGDNPEEWGKFGEDAAKPFYEKLGYRVTKQPDKDGYDFKCVKADSKLFVEVKTINPTYNDMVRITKNEWRAMCEIPNSDYEYELFIVCHMGTKITKMIRIKSAWETLKEVFSKLDQQALTNFEYPEQEVLIALQRNSNGLANDILFNWKRLVKTGLSKNIEEVSS